MKKNALSLCACLLASGLIYAGTEDMTSYKKNDRGKNGQRGVAIGDGSGANSTNDNTDFVYVGFEAGKNIGEDNGDQNIIIGSRAASGANCVVDGTIAIGFRAANAAQSIDSIYVGGFAGYKASSNDSTFVGGSSGYQMTGDKNTAIGGDSLKYVDGERNIAIGYGAGTNGLDDEFDQSIAIGAYAMVHESNSVAIGSTADVSGTGSIGLGDSARATNDDCIAIGSGSYVTGAGSIALSAGGTVTGENSISIGFDGTLETDDKVYIGNYDTEIIGGIVDWSVLSDARFKTDVREDVSGLEFINQLRPVSYVVDTAKLNERRGIEVSSNDEQAERKSGFISQEVEALVNKGGYPFSGVGRPDNLETDNYTLAYAEFVVPLTKAVQELSAMVEAQGLQIKAQNAQLIEERKLRSLQAKQIAYLEKELLLLHSIGY